MTMRAASCVIAVLAGGWASNAWTGDWPGWRGPHHNGVVPAERLRTDWPAAGPPILWRANVGTGFSSVAVAKGLAFTAGHDGGADVVTCLEATTGAVVWQASYPAELDPNLFEGGPTATPAHEGDDLFTFSRQGLAICWNAATGAERWRVDVPAQCGTNIPGWGFAGSPVVYKDRVLLNAGSGGVALDRRTGAVLWQSDNSDDAAYATPRIVDLAGAATALLLSGKSLRGVDPASGALRWEHRWITRYGVNAADPLVDGDRLWLSSGYAKGNSLLQVTANSVEEVWRHRDMRNQMSPGVLIAGHVYAVDGDENEEPRLKCLEFSSGDVRWEVEGLGAATLIACGETLLVLSGNGELVVAAATPDGFTPTARGRVLTGKCWTPPSLANGCVFCRNAEGSVVCVDLRP